MPEETAHTPVRWTAPTPGMPKRMSRFRFMSDSGEPAAGAPAPGAAPATPATPATPTPADVAGQTPAPAPATAPEGTEAQNVTDLPQWAQTLITKTRDEAANSRTNAKATAAQEATDALTQRLGKALGLIKDGEEAPDAEALTAQLTEQSTAARTAQVELAIFKAATGAGADPQALLDSRSFLNSIKDIDPANSEAVTTAITTATTNNPRLKAARAAARSGADLTGGTGEGAMTAERFAAMKPAEKNELFRTNPTQYRQFAG